MLRGSGALFMLGCYNTVMVKKKSLLKKIPRPFLAIGFVSLTLNAIFIGIIVVGNVLEASGSFDYATTYSGIDRLCSDDFRKTVEKDVKEQGLPENEQKLRVALIDYPCTKNGAGPFYEEGYKAYVKSLGLNP